MIGSSRLSVRKPVPWRKLVGHLQALGRERRGATLVEFAFVAPVFVTLLFGLIQAGLLYWNKSTLDEVAYATARCMSVSTDCETTEAQVAFAVDRAAAYGVRLTDEEIGITAGTTCKGDSNANLVTIDHPMAPHLGAIVPFMPDALSAKGCFPIVS